MKTQNEYAEQAEQFLKDNGIKFAAELVDYGKHFSDDTDNRNIYDITLTRGSDTLTVRFGQSITDTNAGINPSSYDLLACLTKSDPGTFDDFCSDYGYDTDSRKAYATWQAVCEEWRKVEAFFTAEELERLEDIQ